MVKRSLATRELRTASAENDGRVPLLDLAAPSWPASIALSLPGDMPAVSVVSIVRVASNRGPLGVSLTLGQGVRRGEYATSSAANEQSGKDGESQRSPVVQFATFCLPFLHILLKSCVPLSVEPGRCCGGDCAPTFAA